MALGRFEVYAGDFKPGKFHQLRRTLFDGPGVLIMDVGRGTFSREKISLSQIAEVEKASQETVTRLGGAIGWGVAGDVFFGPVGLLAGLVAGGRGTNVDFVCKLKDGRKFVAASTSSTFSRLRAAAATNQWKSQHSKGALEKNREAAALGATNADSIKEAMNFCTSCGRSILRSAPTCPHCGAPQESTRAGTSGENGKNVGRVLGFLAWAYAILFGLAGLSGVFTGQFLTGILVFASAIVVLPPSADLVRRRLNIAIPGWMRVVVALVLVAIAGANIKP